MNLDGVIELATAHGRMQMLSEIIEAERPLLNHRLVNLLSKMRGWKSLSREQKEMAVRACEDRRDESSLQRALKIARRAK